MLKPEHSLAWNNMVILLDNTGISTHTHKIYDLLKIKNTFSLVFFFEVLLTSKTFLFSVMPLSISTCNNIILVIFMLQ